MKKLFALGLVLTMLFAFAGCSDEDTVDKNRILFNVDLNKYITVGEYKGIKVDTASADYMEVYNAVISSDISGNDFYKKITEGTIKEGDTANIDYVGKKDGVAFDGGTAEGYDLEIGSGAFIDGFEDGLIGVAVGSTVDLNLTFPESYQTEELAGKAVVFTVTVNYIATDEGLSPEEYYSKLGFENIEAYYEDVTDRATDDFLLNKIIENCKIEEYPEKDVEYLFKRGKAVIERNIEVSYNIDLETYLSSYGQTEAQFKQDMISNQVKPLMDRLMPVYAVLDKEGLTVTEEDVENKLDEMYKATKNSTKEQLESDYGRYYIEALAAMDKILDIAYKNAKIS